MVYIVFLASGNVVEHLKKYDAGDMLLFAILTYAAWLILWNLLIKNLLRKSKPGSFGFNLYELGSLGTFSIIIFLIVPIVLLITSFQTIAQYGTKLLLLLVIFWGGLITITIFIIRSIFKKK